MNRGTRQAWAHVLIIAYCAAGAGCKQVGASSRIKSDPVTPLAGSSSAAMMIRIMGLQRQLRDGDMTGESDPKIIALEALANVPDTDSIAQKGPSDSKSGDYAAQVLVKVYFDSQIPGWATKLQDVVQARFSKCISFDNCARKIAHLSGITPISPPALAGAGVLGVMDSLEQSFAAAVPQPFMQAILKARLNTLRLTTDFYWRLGFNTPESFARVPHIVGRDVQEFRDRFAQALQGYAAIVPGDAKEQTTLLAFIKKYCPELQAHYKAIDPALKMSKSQYIQLGGAVYGALVETLAGLQSMQNYVERLATRSPSAWLDAVAATSDLGQARAYAQTLIQFSKWELPLGTGTKWVDTLEGLQQRFFPDEDVIKQVVAAKRQELAAFDTMRHSFVTKNNMSFTGAFFGNEAAVLGEFDSFDSFIYEILRINRQQAALNDVIKGFANPKSPTPDEATKLKDQIWQVEVTAMTSMCFGYIYTAIHEPGSLIAGATGIKSTIYKGKSYDARQLCFNGGGRGGALAWVSKTTDWAIHGLSSQGTDFSSAAAQQDFIGQMRQGQASPEANIANYLNKARIHDAVGPAKLQVFLSIATLPLLFLSGGAASAAAAGAGKVMAQVTLAEAINAAGAVTTVQVLKAEVTNQLVLWAAKAAVQFAIECVVFSAANRVAFTVATNVYGVIFSDPAKIGVKGIYDTSRSFSANVAAFGYEVLSGVPFMICLPIAGAIGKRVGVAIVGKAAEGEASLLSRELLTFAADAGANAGGMVLIETATKQIEAMISGTPELQQQTRQNPYLKALFLGMGFTYASRSFSHGVSEKEPDVPPELIAQVDMPEALPEDAADGGVAAASGSPEAAVAAGGTPPTGSPDGGAAVGGTAGAPP